MLGVKRTPWLTQSQMLSRSSSSFVELIQEGRRRRKMIEWFDDLALGMRFKSGKISVTKEEIKRFAAEFDPQPFHLDESAAQKTILKGLAASGWHTAAISMSLIVKIRPFGPQPLMGL